MFRAIGYISFGKTKITLNIQMKVPRIYYKNIIFLFVMIINMIRYQDLFLFRG